MGFKTTLMACGILLRDVGCRYHLHTNTLHCPSDFCMLCRLKCCHDSTPGGHPGVKRGHVEAFEGKPVQPTNQDPKTYLTQRCQHELPALRGSKAVLSHKWAGTHWYRITVILCYFAQNTGNYSCVLSDKDC